MYPTLWSFGPLEFHSYVVMLALAVLVGVFLTIWKNDTLETPYPITTIGGLWVLIGGMFGARIWWILQYDSPWNLYQAFKFWEGGLVFYGGLLGGVVAGWGYLRYCRVPILEAGDLIMPQVPLAHAIARMGCFLNGCCWGAPTTQPWGVVFPAGSQPYREHLHAGIIAEDATHSAAVHPTQLYSALGLVLLFFVMRFAYTKKHPPGGVFFLYPVLYGVMRFVVEIYRGDTGRPVGQMTLSQLFSLGIAGVGALALIWVWARYLRGGDAASTTGE